MNIFAQAANNQPLTPAQRAFLKLVEGFFLSALLVAGQTFFQYAAVGAVDWQAALHTALIAGAVAFLLAVAKYYKSHGDPLIGALADTAAQAIESANPTLYNRAEAGAAPAAPAANVTVTASTPNVTPAVVVE